MRILGGPDADRRLLSNRDVDELESKLRRLQRSHDRYEALRRLNPREFSALWQAHIRGDGAFDDLVDQLILGDLVGRLMQKDIGP